MGVLAFVLTTVALLASPPAFAQQTGALVRGNVVMATSDTLVVRTDRREIRVVDMKAVPPGDWHVLEPGDPVVVVGTPEAGAATAAATSVRRDPRGRRAQYHTARGVVRAVSGTLATVRGNDGQVLSLDLASVPAAARPSANDPVIVAYERGPESALTALWVERDTSDSSASVSTAPAQTPGGPPAAAAPPRTPGPPAVAAVPPGTEERPTPPVSSRGYQRIHGYVQAIAGSTLTLRADDGQVVTLETSGVSPDVIAATRAGDIVSVFGRTIGGAFRAEIVQKE